MKPQCSYDLLGNNAGIFLIKVRYRLSSMSSHTWCHGTNISGGFDDTMSLSSFAVYGFHKGLGIGLVATLHQKEITYSNPILLQSRLVTQRLPSLEYRHTLIISRESAARQLIVVCILASLTPIVYSYVSQCDIVLVVTPAICDARQHHCAHHHVIIRIVE